MNKLQLITVGFSSIIGSTSCNENIRQTETDKPNIIYILADDLGYGDLSCYGQQKFKTPNIDRLAKNGIKFTQHYAGCTVSAPSRSTLMTGLHTGHTPIRGNREIKPEGQSPIPESTFTLAELLKGKGYTTGIFGKWGLGFPGSEGEPNKQGFDEFFGYNCQRFGHNYYPRHLWHNNNKVEIKENEGSKTGIYAPTLIHEKTIKFIEDNKDKPFFLYVPSIIPHAELSAPERNMKKYRGKLLPEKAYRGVDSGNGFRRGSYGSQKECHAAFAAMIDLLDEQVGEIVNKVKELGLEKNTIIIFTSDNGPHLEGGADPDFFDSNGKYKGYKRNLYEGGIRVPMIAYCPERIKAGTETDHLSAFWDVMPTIAELTNCKKEFKTDGISFAPTLMGKNTEQKKHDFLYWEFHGAGGKVAVRKGKWKGIISNIRNKEKTKIELFDLDNDIEEKNNIAEQNPQILEELEAIRQKEHEDSKIFFFKNKPSFTMKKD